MKQELTAAANGKKRWFDVPCAYDCEASSFIGSDGREVGMVYSWAFAIYDSVYVGRDVQEFISLLVKLSDIVEMFRTKQKLAVYVHNLQYDFSFLYKLVAFNKVFCVDSRQVEYAEFGRVVLRDSLLLAGGRSLDSVAKNLNRHNVKKLIGNLDYNLTRSPETPLTDKEIAYQENDVLVLTAYIQEKIEDDGGLGNVPMTNTGYVRQALRNAAKLGYGDNMDLLDGLVLSPQAYVVLRAAQAGGYTHGAKGHVGKVLTGVGSFDIKSSYPAVILTKYFPMSQPRPVAQEWASDRANLEDICSKHCCTFIAVIKDITSKGYEYILSESKVINTGTTKDERKEQRESMGAVYFNGRLISASWVRYPFTELDWDSAKKFYNFTLVRVEECYVYARGKLPRYVAVPMMKWFLAKTKLDGVKGQELEYMVSKNMLNAIAGCMEENPLRDEHIYDTENLIFLDPQKPMVTEAIHKYNNNPSRILYYPWGVWILAHARHRLLDVIAHTGRDHVYSDTDSEKLLNWKQYIDYFEEVNAQNREELLEAGRYYHIPIDELMPLKPNGERAVLGKFEFEGEYRRFKTLGAKRYLWEKEMVDKKSGLKWVKYEATVAGASKRLITEYLCGAELDHLDKNNKRVLKVFRAKHFEGWPETEVGWHTASKDPFEAFQNGLVVPSTHAGRLIMRYIDDTRTGIAADYLGNRFEYEVECGVHATPSEYHMNAVHDDTIAEAAFIYAVRGTREDRSSL